MFAAFIISMHGVATSLGNPCPPNSVGWTTPCQPPSPNWRNASLKPDVVRTSPSCQLLGALSPAAFSGASTSPWNFAASSRTASTVSGVASSKPGSVAIFVSPARSRMINSMSLVGAV
ncbi:hypothetical protein D3C85_1584180 [compost metagenome]